MGDAPKDVAKGIHFLGVGDVYDRDQITTSIQDAFDQVTAHLETPAPDVPLSSTAERYPSYSNVRRLALRWSTAGTYGGTDDPRVAQVIEQGGSGLSSDGQGQRFRFETGATLPPFARFPIKASGWVLFNLPPLTMAHGASPSRLAFGCFVPKIQHDLKRIPERVVLRTSAGMQGPTGQLVKAMGTGLYIFPGKEIRCDIDFIPIFGLTADDIEWRLKHLTSFTNGLFGSDDLGGTTVDTSTYENPAVRRQVAIDMVTTTTHFGGLLLATAWGWATTSGSVMIAESVGPPPQGGQEMGLVGLRNAVNDIDDGMISMSLPDIGKALLALPVTSAALSSYLGSGLLRLLLYRGTVDFVLE